MDKKELRSKFINIRKSINDRELKSKIIINKIIESDFYRNSNIIALYYSLSYEVNTIELIRKALTDKKTVALPKIINENTLKFYKIFSLEELICTNSFGIKEPIFCDGNFIDEKIIDLIIVPGICFDEYKNRIGYGKGYYDRYLSKMTGNTKKVGVCFYEQFLKNSLISVDKFDIKMDMIITDRFTV